MTIAELILEASRILRRAGVPEPRLEAGSLLAYILGQDRTFLITHADAEVAIDEEREFREFIRRRASGQPLQYITGRQEFYGLEFEVTPDVLIPRPETEFLVETAIEFARSKATPPIICDLGTGSACIPIAILHNVSDGRAIGLDISPAALRVAARNAARHNVAGRLDLVASDCFSALNPSTARFTLIASNPPYVAEGALDGLQREVRDHEPRVALTPGADGLRIIRLLLSKSPRFLFSGGYLLIEIGFDQHEKVRNLIDPGVWTLLDIKQDLQRIPRTVVLQKN